MSDFRRSRREKKSPESFYEDAKRELEEAMSPSTRSNSTSKVTPKSSSKKRTLEEQDDEDVNEEQQNEEEADSSESETGVEEEEEEDPVIKQRSVSNRKKKVPIQISRNQKRARGGNKANSASSNALLMLSRKTLYPQEKKAEPDDLSMLFTNVLLATQPQKSETRLTDICSALVSLHNSDSNEAQCHLLNFLFRSVGGSLESNIDPNEVILEDLDSEAWGSIVTDLVDEMKYTPLDKIALFAEPLGYEGHQSAGVREYRILYERFWYTLAIVAMEEGRMASSNSRLDAEIIRDIILRVMEVSGVGQPDVRSAATIAILQCGHAVLEKSKTLMNQIETTARQLKSTTKKKSKKTTSLNTVLSTLTRTLENLEELVMQSIIPAVFAHRYRDSNASIRVASLASLSKMTIQRPDLFLSDTFLKYFGWMISDKDPSVRKVAIAGLSAPFEQQLELSKLKNVIAKFLPRIADTVIDKDIGVEESGIKLLLQLLRNGFLDDVEEEHLWNQINLRAIARDTSKEVRKYALYFVMEQLEAFDEGGQQDDKSSKTTKSLTNNTVSESLERRLALQLDTLASWVAHALTDGPVEIENIQLDLSDFVIESLRDMPEYVHLARNWSVLLRCITDDNIASLDGATASDRVDMVKQRVLVKMLTSAVKAEVLTVASYDFLQDVFNITSPSNQKKKVKNNNNSISHESLSVEVLMALPELLSQYQSDTAILTSLTSLPKYLLPTVFSLPQRKSNFLSLVKHLCDIFSSTADDDLQNNIALSLSYLCSGDHSRTSDVSNQMQQLTQGLINRSKELLSTKLKGETEITVALTLQRLNVLCRQWDKILEYFGGDDALEDFSTSLGKGLYDRLKICKDLVAENEFSILTDTISIINKGLEIYLSLLSWSFYQYQLDGKFDEIIEDEDEIQERESDFDHHLIVRLRNELINITELSFELFAPAEKIGNQVNIEMIDSIQLTACRVSSDLRVLFPKIWIDAVHPFLRRLAIKDDGKLIGGFMRYIRSKDDMLRSNEISANEDRDLVHGLFYPLGRSLAISWTKGHRREAGVLLSHITSSGMESSAQVSAISKILKKLDPVRLLEAQMASLRQSYEEWMFNEPELDSDRPTETELEEYEESEKKHLKQFQDLEDRAARLSQSLGVGRLVDPRLSHAMIGFVREGIRYAFSNSDPGADEEELVLGSRLSFLTILVKYTSWMRRNRKQKEQIGNDLDEREQGLRQHADFSDVHEDDLAALASFRAALGLKEQLPVSIPITPVTTENEDNEDEKSVESTTESHVQSTNISSDNRTNDWTTPDTYKNKQSSRASIANNSRSYLTSPDTMATSNIHDSASRHRSSRNSTASSVQSKQSSVYSNLSNLTPVKEERETSEDNASNSLRNNSQSSTSQTSLSRSSISRATRVSSQPTYFPDESSADKSKSTKSSKRSRNLTQPTFFPTEGSDDTSGFKGDSQPSKRSRSNSSRASRSMSKG